MKGHHIICFLLQSEKVTREHVFDLAPHSGRSKPVISLRIQVLPHHTNRNPFKLPSHLILVGPPGPAPTPGMEKVGGGKTTPATAPDSKWAVRCRRVGEHTSNSKWMAAASYFFESGGGGGTRRSALPCWKEHVLFLSLCYFTLGGGWRQLWAPAAERAPSLCTSISITPPPLCVCRRSGVWKSAPKWRLSPQAASERHHNCTLLKGS